ncbi:MULTISPECIES: helix-turn-helix domain-containing protein [Pantoea]|uniref:helix-turn-helix domain-containing protein n=1 Tax=Pantoea TaxID=53335 RepID=UPI0007375841|nr:MULTISPECIES: helix-turn-helix domain-containing protein [Pantoea]KTS17124.1 transcriptional regulator, XRE family protein [Pantoea dispersa]KTS88656.1 transcriptional regulator, XRE family protein [Pantoea dispersa]MCI1027641.1 helix-turn-helix domain-containing protein [Pantoea dispersa]MDI6956773.1 helix-turn-helix domain-containing protein [Pantoea sp. Pa-EAmG]MDR6294703.1 putative transcriptional regulator [Pantoea dispersa]
MVDHLKDLQEIAHDFNPLGVISDELTEKIDSRVRLRELRTSLPVLQLMSGEAIRELRERHGLSQAMLAAYIGLSPATVVKWEREEKKPNGAALRLLNLIDRKGLEVLR